MAEGAAVVRMVEGSVLLAVVSVMSVWGNWSCCCLCLEEGRGRRLGDSSFRVGVVVDLANLVGKTRPAFVNGIPRTCLRHIYELHVVVSSLAFWFESGNPQTTKLV